MLLFTSIENLPNILESFKLYFENFEFNASLFYLTKFFAGPTLAHKIMTYMTLGLGLAIIYSGVRRWKYDQVMFFKLSALVLTIYLLFSSVVHPWYITPIIAFSVFTKQIYPIVWSFLILLSYSAYTATGVEELEWLVAGEYLGLIRGYGRGIF